VHNNPITLTVLQAAIDTAVHFGPANKSGLITAQHADMRGDNIQQLCVLLHWVHCRMLEIEAQAPSADPETVYNPFDNAAQYFQAWALVSAWNQDYRRENVIADYLYARMVQYMGNGDVTHESPLSPNAAFDSILPHEIRAMLDRIAQYETDE